MPKPTYPHGSPEVFTSPSGRLSLIVLPWYDDQHDDIVKEIDDLIEGLQGFKRVRAAWPEKGGADA